VDTFPVDFVKIFPREVASKALFLRRTGRSSPETHFKRFFAAACMSTHYKTNLFPAQVKKDNILVF
jgi:hypothetical protein